MTNEEAKKMLKAKLECFKNETSGINYDCNMRLCDGCSLNYEQGNMGEQKEALDTAIKALEQTRPKGKWKPLNYKDEMWGFVYKCSNCGAIEYGGDYCPNCGADMESEDAE